MGVWGAAVSVGKGMFGDKDGPGVLGTGQRESQKYDINKDAFYDQTTNDANKADLKSRLAGVDARTAPQMSAASVGNASTAAGTGLGPANTMDSAKVGAAHTGTASDIAGSSYEANQGNYIKSLEDQAAGKGPSLAGAQLKDATERNTANQMAMAASGKSANNTSLGLRNVATNSAALGQNAAKDAASMKIQEQMNAQGMLGNAITGARGQDLSKAQAQAGMNQQMSLANMGALNERQFQQAQLNQQGGLANMAAKNQYGLTQGAMDQASQFKNMDALNQFKMQQAGFNQQAGMSNQQAQLGTMGMNDAMARYYSQAGIGIDQQSMQNKQLYEQLANQQQMNANQVDAQSYANAAATRSNLISSLGQAAAGAASDEEAKSNIKKGDDFVDKFLAQMGGSSGSGAPAVTEGKGGFADLKHQIGGKMDFLKNSQQLNASKMRDADTKMLQEKLGKKAETSDKAMKVDTSNDALNSSAEDQLATTDYSGNYGLNDNGTAATMGADAGASGAATTSVDTSGLESLSDEEEKKAVKPGSPSIKDFLDKAQAYHYEYKDDEKGKPGRGFGEYVSPMAQDLEKSDLGKDMVYTGPDGKKMVDYGKGFGTMLASISSLNKRIEEIEAKKKKG